MTQYNPLHSFHHRLLIPVARMVIELDSKGFARLVDNAIEAATGSQTFANSPVSALSMKINKNIS